jgi:hypothetical protein
MRRKTKSDIVKALPLIQHIFYLDLLKKLHQMYEDSLPHAKLKFMEDICCKDAEDVEAKGPSLVASAFYWRCQSVPRRCEKSQDITSVGTRD